MTHDLFTSRIRAALVAFASASLFACVTAGLAAATPLSMPATTTGTTSLTAASCTNPLLTQPFLSNNDTNQYTLVPGESPGSFQGTGWTLSGGASVVSTTLGDGQKGTALDLPSGSSAVSPSICVSSDFPTARTRVRNVVGGEGVQFYVSYQGTSTWLTPRNTGQFHGAGTSWTASDSINLQPANQSGWQIVRFAFVPGGKTSDFQMYDFYVDPRMKD